MSSGSRYFHSALYIVLAAHVGKVKLKLALLLVKFAACVDYGRFKALFAIQEAHNVEYVFHSVNAKAVYDGGLADILAAVVPMFPGLAAAPLIYIRTRQGKMPQGRKMATAKIEPHMVMADAQGNIYDDPDLLASNEAFPSFMEALKTGNGIEAPRMDYSAEYISMVDEYLDYIYNGTMGIEDALNELQAQAEAMAD